MPEVVVEEVTAQLWEILLLSPCGLNHILTDSCDGALERCGGIDKGRKSDRTTEMDNEEMSSKKKRLRWEEEAEL